MRNINKLIVFVVLLCNAFAGLSQQKFDIVLKAYYTGYNTLLRWYPKDIETYQKCVEEGFVVERRQPGSVEGWTTLSPIIKGSFGDIFNLEKKTKEAALLSMILYKDLTMERIKQEMPDSLDAFKEEYRQMTANPQAKSLYYAMFLLSTEFSVDIAKYAALNYLDDKVQTQQVYEYRVRPKNEKLKLSCEIAKITTNKKTELPAVSQLKSLRNDKSVRFSWFLTPEMDEAYSGYDLERSEDGIHFKKVNERPIIHITMSDVDKDSIFYRGDLPECGKKYYYRIVGLSGFGFTGKPSNVVTEKCVDRYTVRPMVNTIRFNNKVEAEITWTVDNPDKQEIRAFEVQRARHLHVTGVDSFEAISKRLSPKTFSFVDKRPFKTNYYRIAAYGDEGQVGYSNIVFKYPADTMPPSIPTGLKGVIDSAGICTLTWNQNPEDDIRGYRVFVSNDSTFEFLCCTDTILKETKYTTKLFLGSLTNDIYYKVQAVGGNYAHSGLSPFIKLMKPDTIPPALIVFDEIKQNEDNSLQFSWFDSPSIDVAKVDLYRKILPDTTWTLAEQWTGKTTSRFFADTVAFVGEKVTYKFNIYDESGNVAVAEMVPYQTKILRQHCLKNLRLVKDHKEGGIFVEWSRCGCQIKFVRIFRKEDGGDYKIVKTVKGNDTSYFDKSVYVGHEYEYMVLPITEKMSEPEVEKVNY